MMHHVARFSISKSAMLLPVGRLSWKLLCFLLLAPVAASVDWSEHSEHIRNMLSEELAGNHREAQQGELPEMQLRELVDQYMADKLGMQGQALIGFMVAALMLLRGGWLLTDSPARRISWFMMGCAVGFCWMVYVATPEAELQSQLQLALGISCHSGVLLALFPQAGCYIIGAAATALAIHLVHASTLSASALAIRVVHVARNEPDIGSFGLAWLQVAAGILGGYLCNRFSKVSLDFIFSLAGSAVMVLMTYWWLNEAFHWCFHRPDPNGSSPLQYWLALWSFQARSPWTSVYRWSFSLCWLLVFWAGQRLRKRLEISEADCLHRRLQEQIRRAPDGCDRMPWQPGLGGRSQAPELPEETGDHRPSAPEEDFGMYLLPEDLESMKRSKSIPCFTPENRPKAKIVPLRSTASLPSQAGSRPRRSLG